MVVLSVEDRGVEMQVDHEILQPPCSWVLRNREGEALLLSLTPGEERTVGREQSCDVPILDAGISRRHARFFAQQGNLWIEDLNSQNGTFLNGERVQKSRVRPGDILTLGRIPLTVQQMAEPPAAGESAGTRLLKGIPPERLAFLLSSSFRLADSFERPGLYQLILELAMEEFHPDRGAILIPERGKFHVVAVHPREGFRDLSARLSRQLCESVFQSRAGRLIRETPGMGGRLALAGERATVMICAPLLGRREALGAVFLEVFADHRSYPQADADCLLAYAGIAGRWLEAAHQLSGARVKTEEYHRRSLRWECDLDRMRGQLQEARRWAGFGDLLSAGLDRMASALEQLQGEAGELAGTHSAARPGRDLLRTAGILGRTISGISYLCNAGKGRADPVRIPIRGLIDDAVRKLDLPERDRIRWTHTDPSLTVETVQQDALRWIVLRILEVALVRPCDSEKDGERHREREWPLESGPKALLRLARDEGGVLFTCEVPGEMDGVAGGNLDALELELLHRIAREVLRGEFLFPPSGPVRAYSLRIPERLPAPTNPDETAVFRQGQLMTDS